MAYLSAASEGLMKVAAHGGVDGLFWWFTAFPSLLLLPFIPIAGGEDRR